jgi:hypothetical protein
MRKIIGLKFVEMRGEEKLTCILLTWRIRRVPNNARKWQMGFNTAIKGLIPRLGLHR